MQDAHIPHERIQDPFEKNEPGLGLGRDPQRTPMQWDDTQHAGFTTGEPWLPVSDTYHQCNVRRLAEDPASILSLYRELIRLRHRTPALSVGRYSPHASTHDVLAYKRSTPGARVLVALNFGPREERVPLPAPAQVLLSTRLDRVGENLTGEATLRPNEGLVMEITLASSAL